jgi:hypothetical protein
VQLRADLLFGCVMLREKFRQLSVKAVLAHATPPIRSATVVKQSSSRGRRCQVSGSPLDARGSGSELPVSGSAGSGSASSPLLERLAALTAVRERRVNLPYALRGRCREDRRAGT